mmetsp:Transcript_33651/g.100221  ORF Transcript_33651/g.100221 Transcript_33651/m.100221 type:complete len:219 (-) Transcript_33651:114-770(-)
MDYPLARVRWFSWMRRVTWSRPLRRSPDDCPRRCSPRTMEYPTGRTAQGNMTFQSLHAQSSHCVPRQQSAYPHSSASSHFLQIRARPRKMRKPRWVCWMSWGAPCPQDSSPPGSSLRSLCALNRRVEGQGTIVLRLASQATLSPRPAPTAVLRPCRTWILSRRGVCRPLTPAWECRGASRSESPSARAASPANLWGSRLPSCRRVGGRRHAAEGSGRP